MIEVKVGELVNSTNILRKLSTMELKGAVAFEVGRLVKRIEEELKLFDETRGALIQKYASRDEEGNLIINSTTNEYVFTTENMIEFRKELEALLDKEVELNAKKIQLQDISELNFTPAELIELEPLIEE